MMKKQLMKNSEKELFSSDESDICEFSESYFSRDGNTKCSKNISRLNMRTLAYNILIKMHISCIFCENSMSWLYKI